MRDFFDVKNNLTKRVYPVLTIVPMKICNFFRVARVTPISFWKSRSKVIEYGSSIGLVRRATFIWLGGREEGPVAIGDGIEEDDLPILNKGEVLSVGRINDETNKLPFVFGWWDSVVGVEGGGSSLGGKTIIFVDGTINPCKKGWHSKTRNCKSSFECDFVDVTWVKDDGSDILLPWDITTASDNNFSLNWLLIWCPVVLSELKIK